jgi:hypothetical protein
MASLSDLIENGFRIETAENGFILTTPGGEKFVYTSLSRLLKALKGALE